MGTLEIKKELHRFIDEGDDKFIKIFYEMANTYVVQMEKDKMIMEGEEDITKRRVYTLAEAREKLEDWKVSEEK